MNWVWANGSPGMVLSSHETSSTPLLKLLDMEVSVPEEAAWGEQPSFLRGYMIYTYQLHWTKL